MSDSPPPASVWNDRAREHRRAYRPDRPWYTFAEELIRTWSPPDKTALDVGCGLGEFLERLKRLGYHATGADGSREQIAAARTRGHQAICLDLEQRLPFDADSFGLVVCLEVIEHIARARPLLEEIIRVLQPGGAVVLSTPNFAFYRNRIRCLKGAPPPNEGIHLRFFTPGTLERLLRDAGFRIRKRASYGPISGLNFIRRVCRRPDRYTVFPRPLDPLLAYTLVYLADVPDARSA